MSLKLLSGVHIPHRKNTAEMPPVRMPPPAMVTIPLSMSIGRPANCVVKPGDHVDVGTLIAVPGGYVGAPVHASVSGTVKKIVPVLQFMGTSCQGVQIESDGAMTPAPDLAPPVITDYASFIKAVLDSGVVGLGGATFPASVKLDVKDTSRIQEIIINAAECEGYITSDNRTMIDRTDEVVEGCRLLEKWLDVKKIIIGIEDNKPDCIKKLTEVFADDKCVEIRTLPSLYPQGGEKVLVYHTTGKIIPEGKLPLDVGSIVMNVTSLATLAHFCLTGMPLVEKCITVDGSAVKEPKNVIAPIGTSSREVIEFAGGLKEEAGKLVQGGPMMGVAQSDLDAPVAKGTSALLVFNRKDARPAEPTACIKCGGCIDHCPMSLMPMEIERAYEKKDGKLLKELKVGLCMECGCCAFQCPAHRPLVQVNKLAKNVVREYEASLKAQQEAKK
jgi:electron transport complex protein RnfC